MLLLCYGTYFSGKARSFNSEWFQQYLWLKYSIKKDAGYCCLFGSTSTCTSRPEEAVTTSGFREWKVLRELLLSHNNCISHKEAVVE